MTPCEARPRYGWPSPSSGRPAALLAVAVWLSASACAEPLEFADWTIPVPEGTRVVEYAPVPLEERADAVSLQRDLVLTEAFGRPLYQPSRIAVSQDDTMYVLDAGNFRVVAFDGDGNALHEFGQQGQGPGELGYPAAIAVVGDSVVINDLRNSRLSVFGLDGELVADNPLEQPLDASVAVGVGADLILIHPNGIGVGQPPEPWIAGRYSIDGTQLSVAVELEMVSRTHWREGARSGSVPMRAAYPTAAIAGDGTIHATNSDEYQVLAVRPDGEALWALRVAYTPPAPSEADKDDVVRMWREYRPELSASNFTWPDRYAAIENVQVDGHGNLYVFPHAGRTRETVYRTDRPVPVDVYSPEGERLFTGMIAIENWHAALGDHVYRIETDPTTEEQVVVRYRLTEPFRWIR